MLTITYAGMVDLGRVREDNEDNWAADPDLGLYIVADGMGGHLGGGLASRVVAETLPLLVRKVLGEAPDLSESDAPEKVRQLLADLSTRLRDGSRDQPGLRGMGSTVVLGLIRNGHGIIAYMGDSRAYLLRNKELRQLTQDHTLVRLLIESGDITPEEAATHPSRGQLTRYVGMDGEPLPECQRLDLLPGDMLLLCSDGLTGMVPDSAIQYMLQDKDNLELVCKDLVAAANDAGGKDNICVLVLKCTEDPRAEVSRPAPMRSAKHSREVRLSFERWEGGHEQ